MRKSKQRKKLQEQAPAIVEKLQEAVKAQRANEPEAEKKRRRFEIDEKGRYTWSLQGTYIPAKNRKTFAKFEDFDKLAKVNDAEFLKKYFEKDLKEAGAVE